MSTRPPSTPPERWASAPGHTGVEVSSLGQVRDASGLLSTQRHAGITLVMIGGKPVAVAPLVRSVFPRLKSGKLKGKPKKKRGAR